MPIVARSMPYIRHGIGSLELSLAAAARAGPLERSATMHCRQARASGRHGGPGATLGVRESNCVGDPTRHWLQRPSRGVRAALAARAVSTSPSANGCCAENRGRGLLSSWQPIVCPSVV